MADQQSPKPSADLETLEEATAGLMYPSESEAPFDVFRWNASGPDLLKDVQAHAKKGLIQEQLVDDFFEQLRDSDDAQRFAELRRAMESVVTGLKVYRSGRIEVDVFIIGKSHSGDWIGLHTVSVET